MMILEYDRERAQLRCQKIECLLGTLIRRMGEGCGPSRCYREPSSGEVSNCTCITCRRTTVGFLAGGSRAGR